LGLWASAKRRRQVLAVGADRSEEPRGEGHAERRGQTINQLAAAKRLHKILDKPLWCRNGLPQQTHTLIENSPRGSQTLLKIQVATDHGSVGFLDRRQSQDVLL
jgi:hypothetical protein